MKLGREGESAIRALFVFVIIFRASRETEFEKVIGYTLRTRSIDMRRHRVSQRSCRRAL